MAQQQIRKESQTSAPPEVEELPVKDQAKARESLEDIDDLLDAIDAVLEENAEEFVQNYVQKGGQ